MRHVLSIKDVKYRIILHGLIVSGLLVLLVKLGQLEVRPPQKNGWEATSNINIPEEHISKIHTENAVLLHNCLFLRS